MRQASPGHVGDVQQAVDAAHVDERAVLGEVLDDAGQDAALFEVLERLAALFVLLFFEQLLARDDDVAALLVELDDGDFHRLALHAIEIADGTKVNLRAGQEGARALNVDGEAALDALDDDAFDRLLFVVGALDFIPRAETLRFEVREVDVALFGFALLAHDVDFVAGLELGLALVIENFGERHHAFGLRAVIDDDVGRGQLNDAAFDDVVFANSFFGFGLEVVQGGGEIIARGCGRFGSGSLRIFVLRIHFRSFGNGGGLVRG